MGMEDEADGFAQVRVDLPNHWGATGEALPAEELGGGRYRICAVPTYAYGLNRHDVVEATVGPAGSVPEVRRVLVPSEHQTLRVRFVEGILPGARQEYLESLRQFGVHFESTNLALVALDLPPGTKVADLCARLDEWEHGDIADWESAEARAPGRFDEGPS